MRPLLVLFARSSGITAQFFKNSSFNSSSRTLCSSRNGDSKKNRSLLTDNLRSQKVTIGVNSGNVTLDAVVQDTMPGGSKVGTVVASHGCPGSHKDFKYLQPSLKDAGIRFIGINFPGFGYTPNSASFQHSNPERLDFVQAIVDQLDVQGALVFMGHSRGSENALRMGARNADRCAGVLLVNPIGLRLHRGVRLPSVIHTCTVLWNLGWVARLLLWPFLPWIYYSVVKFRIPNRDQAALCLRLVDNVDCASQQPIVEKLNNRSDVAVVIAYGGLDPMIEPKICREFADAFHAGPELVGNADSHDDSKASQQLDKLLREGQTKVAVRFDKENHFLQKHRAVFLADAIRAILSNTNKI